MSTPSPAPPKKKRAALSPAERQMHVQLGLLALAVLIDVLGFSIIIPLAPDFVQHGLHAPPSDPRIGEYVGWLTASYALMQFVFAPVWGALSDRVGRKPILIGSLVGDAVFYALFGLSAGWLPGLFAARILAGIFSSASLAVAQAYAADITPPHLRAMALGYVGAAFGVGFVFGPALGGLLGHFSLSLPLYVASALAIVNIAYIRAKLPEPKREAHKPSAAPGGFAARLGRMTDAVRGPMGFLYLLTFAVTFAFWQPGGDVHDLSEAALRLRAQQCGGRRWRICICGRPDCAGAGRGHSPARKAVRRRPAGGRRHWADGGGLSPVPPVSGAMGSLDFAPSPHLHRQRIELSDPACPPVQTRRVRRTGRDFRIVGVL